MRRIYKIGIIFVISFFALMILGVFILRIMYPPQKIKEIACLKLSDIFKRQTQISDVSIGFSGIKLKDVLIFDKLDTEQEFLNINKLSIKPKIFALIRGKFIVNEIYIDKPKIKIIRYKDKS